MTLELNNVVPWGRSFDEYLRMFDLGAGDLEKDILGCADGPSSFNAGMAGRGKRVISADPVYRFSADQIRARILEVFDTMVENAEAKAEYFVWDELGSPKQLGERRMTAMNVFLDDYPSGLKEGRYIDASLPALPFDDHTFDLALCSHYLFTYSDLIDEGQHVQAILEMCRVAGEVRVFPLVKMFGGGLSEHVEGVVGQLRKSGMTTNIQQVPYEVQRGGNQMLVILRT
ncbi:MAG: class I SAM-dependent methyltransferase [Planctomycetota bacterium]|jgi:hypothetical protein